MNDDLDIRLDKISSLGEPIRRALYRFVGSQTEAVTREQAARATGVAQHVAKFHLDRLVDDGLLEAGYQRPAGRGGPGAGRPAKVYRRAASEVSVALPERRYDLAASVLAGAVESVEQEGTAMADAVDRVARETGRRIGCESRDELKSRSSRDALLATTRAALDRIGFETRADPAGIVLANCPFHTLVELHSELVCGMNLSLLRGVLEGIGAARVEARADPGPGRCCVRLIA